MTDKQLAILIKLAQGTLENMIDRAREGLNFGYEPNELIDLVKSEIGDDQYNVFMDEAK